ncbi:MAG: DUF4838 domain-containing protein [Victivallales bacterium]|nr:DUF4838 domain-containing protein [Victivallales bacterium]
MYSCVLKQVAFCVLASLCLYGFDIVKNGKYAEIVLPENAYESSRLAANELAEYVRKTTGREIKVVIGKSDAASKIHIGTLDTLKAIPPSAAKALASAKQKEAYYIFARGRDMYIIGKQEVAELYGTYQFIEDKLGVRWLKPADSIDKGEYTPKLKDIAFPDYEKFSEPAFAVRRLDQVSSYVNVIPKAGKTWATRNGYPTPAAYSSPIPYDKPESETYKFYAPRIPRNANKLGGGHTTFVKPMPPKTTFDQHPEYFALIDGKRVKGEQYCISNPEVRRNVANYIISRLDETKGLGEYTFGMVDTNAGWCECDECRKLDEDDTFAGSYQNVSTRFQKTVRAIAEMVYEKYPDADLRTWAYHTYRMLPQGVSIHPKMKVQLCLHGRCYAHSLDDPDCPRNAQFYKLLLDWLKAAPELYTYEYFSPSHPYYVCHEQIIGKDLRLYQKLGLYGWKDEGVFPDSKFYPPRKNDTRKDLMPSNWQWAYVTAKLLWNPNLDEKAILDEAEKLYYGKAYPMMKQYHALRRKLWLNTPICMGYPRGDDRRPHVLNVPDSGKTLMALLDAAQGLAAGDKVLEHRLVEDRRWLTEYWIKPNQETKAKQGKNLQAPMVKTKVIIDGKGNDDAWVSAFYLTDGLKQTSDDKKDIPAPLRTMLGILCDQENMYFLVTALEPTLLKNAMKGKKDPSILKNESVHLFLCPPSTSNAIYHIHINPEGKIINSNFPQPAEVKTKIMDDRYVIEARIPMAKLKLPRQGELWRINLMRTRRINDNLTPLKDGVPCPFTLDGSSIVDAATFRPLEIGKQYLKNGAFDDVDDKGKPKAWSLDKNASMVKAGNGYALKLEKGAVYQLLASGELGQKPSPRKISYSFKASGKGKLNVYMIRYNDTPDPKAKHGYRRTIHHPAGNGGTFTLTQSPQLFSGEYTIQPNEWIGFRFANQGEAIIDDVSLHLKTP